MNNYLDNLICPKCNNKLIYTQNFIECKKNHKWKKINGIPRLLENNNNYTHAFGLQWKKYIKTQLDSHTQSNISSDRLLRCLGDAKRIINTNKQVNILEVGCGAGRFTEILLSMDSCYVTSIDFSNAVEANQENFPISERHTLIQCDINNNPFKNNQFDIVMALGVVQHTPNPEITIENMYALVRPGGYLVFDHYTFGFSYYTKSTMFFRVILKRLNPQLGMMITENLVKYLFPLHYKIRNFYILQIILSRFSPVRVYFKSFPQLSRQLQYEFSLLDTHDSLTDYYKHFRTKRQILKILNKLKAIDMHINKGGNGIEVHCKKPEDI